MADKKIDIAALGQAMDTTWGRSSTPQTASYSVKMTFAGDGRVLATFREIINFVAEKEMIKMKKDCAEDSLKIIDEHVKKVKKIYKDLTGGNVNLKELETSDSLEIIGFNVHNPKRTAYYLRRMTLEIS